MLLNMYCNYNINNFNYNKENNTLIGNEEELHINNVAPYFPNYRKQFFVSNDKTKNFRRFRLSLETCYYYLFESEDKIKCIINKKLNMFSTGNF